MPATARQSTAVDTPGARRALAARVVEELGGRYSAALGIDLDAGAPEIERWALAASLYGGRISAKIAERTFAVLEHDGIENIADAGRRDIATLIELLDAGGYARYDMQTATRLHAMAEALRAHGGRIAWALELPPESLRASLEALPGWGPVTVGLFVRELRGVRPQIDPPLDERAARAGEHLGLIGPRGRDTLAQLRELARAAGLDLRDLEAALVRLALAHGRDLQQCPGGAACRLLAPR